MKVYKIRKKGTTNLFSSGGPMPRWTTRGKTWSSLGHIKTHLAGMWPSSHHYANYADAEIVEFEMVEKIVTDLAVLVQEVKDAKGAKLAKDTEARRKRAEDLEREQLRVLQRKYPSQV